LRARATRSRRFCQGELTPLPSLGDAKGVPATTGVDPRRPPRHGLQWERPLSSLPLHRLDRDPIGRPPGSLSNPTNPLWGFPHSCERRCKGGRGEEAGRRELCGHHCRRAAAGGRPWRGGAGPGATRGEDAHTETGRRDRELSKEPGATVNPYTASPSSSSQRRLHLRPAVRTSIFPLLLRRSNP
jgi:hypothetical protein